MYNKIRTSGIESELEVTVKTSAFSGETPKGLSCPIDKGPYI